MTPTQRHLGPLVWFTGIFSYKFYPLLGCFSCVNSDVTLSAPWPSFLLLYYSSSLCGLLPWCVCFQTPRARCVCACMFLQCKLLETLWHGHQERLGSSVNVSIAGWEGTRWQTNEGWTNLLNDTTWNATFKIPSGLRPLRTWSVKHDTYLYTCWWSTQACPIGWWHAPPASWPPNPAALVCFGSLPLSPADHSVFISVGCVRLGLWSWGYLPLLYWLSGFVTSRRVRLGLLLISGPLAVKSLQYLGGRLKAHRWCLVIVQILDGHKWRMSVLLK